MKRAAVLAPEHNEKFETSFRIDVLENQLIVTNSSEWEDAFAYIDGDTRNRSYVITVIGNFVIPSTTTPNIPNRTDGTEVTLRTPRREKANLRLALLASKYAPALYITENQTLIIDGEGLTITYTFTRKPV